MPKFHDKIYYAVILRQNRLAMKWIDQNRVTIEKGLYRGAVQLLHHAIKFRNYRFAGSLLKRGVNINGVDGFDHTAIQNAAQRGHVGGIKWLMRQGANFEEEKDDLLLAAVRCSHLKLIRWLVEKGCDVNAIRESDGENPLSHCYRYCSHENRDETAALLRQNGAEFPQGFDPCAVADED